MAQSCVIMAFRKRAKSHGYKEISIRTVKGGKCFVKAVEPMTEAQVSKEFSDMYELNSIFRRGRPASK